MDSQPQTWYIIVYEFSIRQLGLGVGHYFKNACAGEKDFSLGRETQHQLPSRFFHSRLTGCWKLHTQRGNKPQIPLRIYEWFTASYKSPSYQTKTRSKKRALSLHTMMVIQVSMPSSTSKANRNINTSAPRQPRRRISLEQRRSSLEQQQEVHQSSSRQRRGSLEQRGSIEIHPSAMRRRSSGDSFANYNYQDMVAAMEVVRRFAGHQDSLARIEYHDFSDNDEDGDLSDCILDYESSSACDSVSSLEESEAEEAADEDDACCTTTAAALVEEATASSSADDNTDDALGNATISPYKGVRFATHAQIREYSITMQATVENACRLCLSWEYTTPDQRVPVRNASSKPIRQLSLHQREKRLALVTGLTLDEIYEMEEDSLLQQIEEVMTRSGKTAAA